MSERAIEIGGSDAETAEPEPEPPRGLALDVVRAGGDWSAFEPVESAVAAVAGAFARRLRLRSTEAAVALASDAHVRELNHCFRGKDRPTNVLSFPARTAESGFLGDIVLAAETVAREAAEQGIEPAHHLQHLVLHGLLHLLGHDHATEAEAATMEGLETAILADVGVADPYALPDASR